MNQFILKLILCIDNYEMNILWKYQLSTYICFFNYNKIRKSFLSSFSNKLVGEERSLGIYLLTNLCLVGIVTYDCVIFAKFLFFIWYINNLWRTLYYIFKDLDRIQILLLT